MAVAVSLVFDCPSVSIPFRVQTTSIKLLSTALVNIWQRYRRRLAVFQWLCQTFKRSSYGTAWYAPPDLWGVKWSLDALDLDHEDENAEGCLFASQS